MSFKVPSILFYTHLQQLLLGAGHRGCSPAVSEGLVGDLQPLRGVGTVTWLSSPTAEPAPLSLP